MSLIPSIIFAILFVIIWWYYRFVHKKQKLQDKHILHFFAVAFLGPVVWSSVEMLYYGTTGAFLLAQNIETIREPIGFGGLLRGFIAAYVFWKELTGEISEG